MLSTYHSSSFTNLQVQAHIQAGAQAISNLFGPQQASRPNRSSHTHTPSQNRACSALAICSAVCSLARSCRTQTQEPPQATSCVSSTASPHNKRCTPAGILCRSSSRPRPPGLRSQTPPPLRPCLVTWTAPHMQRATLVVLQAACTTAGSNAVRLLLM